jgi:hypothetical protein
MANIKIKHKGYVDIDKVIKKVSGILRAKKYNAFQDIYKYSAGGREVFFKADKKVDEYAKYNLNVFVLAFGLKKVELIKNGKKTITKEGTVMVDINYYIDQDHADAFGKNEFLVTLKKLFQNTILNGRIFGKYRKENEADAVEVAKEIRKILEHET